MTARRRMLALHDGEVAALKGWLQQTPPAFRQAVLERAVRRQFKCDEPIPSLADSSGGMYGVVSGLIRATRSAEEHGPYFFHLLRPGVWFEAGPATLGQPRFITLFATRPTILMHLNPRAMQEIAQADPVYWRFFGMPLMGNLEDAMCAVTDLMLRDPVKRLIAVILRLGGCRVAISDDAPIEIDANQEDIATMANLSRTTTGSALRQWQTDGLIELAYGRLIILAPNKLRRLLAT